MQAVIAASAPANALLVCNRSISGAPRNTNMKHGTNVTHSVSAVAASPPALPDSAPGARKPVRKPTNCSTRISGPGVVSARPSPASISCGASQ